MTGAADTNQFLNTELVENRRYLPFQTVEPWTQAWIVQPINDEHIHTNGYLAFSGLTDDERSESLVGRRYQKL